MFFFFLRLTMPWSRLAEEASHIVRKKHKIRLDLSLVTTAGVWLLCNNCHQFLSCMTDSSSFRLISRAACDVVTPLERHKQGAGPGTTLLTCSPCPWDTFTLLLWCHNRRRWGKKFRELIPHHSQCLRAGWGKQGQPLQAGAG